VTAVRAWGAARRVGGMDRDVDKPGEASNRPSPFLNSLKHEPTTRFHKSLIGLCRSRSCDSCRAHSLGTIGSSRAAWSTMIATLGRVHTSFAQRLTFRNSIHGASTLPYSQEHAESRYKSVRALVWGSKVSAAAFRSYCDAHPSCAYVIATATQRSISLSLVQLLLRLPCVARRRGALGICTSTRTMRQSPVPHASGSCITIAGGSQEPHFHQKRENLRLWHFGTLPQHGLMPPDLVVLLGKCPGSRSSRSADVTGRGHCVCESAGNRFFACWTNPLV
jgi:hypothetical protein